MRDVGEGIRDVKQNDGRKVFGGRAFESVGLFFCFWGQGSFAWAAVAEVSLIRALASMSIMLLRPCLPQMSPFCCGSAQLVMAPEMVWLIAAAMVLLSVFFET